MTGLFRLASQLRRLCGLYDAPRGDSDALQISPDPTRLIADHAARLGSDRRIVGNVSVFAHGDDRKRGCLHEADNRFHGSENAF